MSAAGALALEGRAADRNERRTMRPKIILTISLLTFVAASVGYLVVTEVIREDAPDRKLGDFEHKVGIYYFYFLPRCPSCNKLEGYARQATEEGFADAIEAGRLEWRSIDIDEPGNKHFVKDFRLYTKAVVLVEIRDGEIVRWKNLEDVWNFIRDKDECIDFVKDELSAFMRGAPE